MIINDAERFTVLITGATGRLGEKVAMDLETGPAGAAARACNEAARRRLRELILKWTGLELFHG